MGRALLIKLPDEAPESVRKNLECIADTFQDIHVLHALPNVQVNSEFDIVPTGLVTCIRADSQLHWNLLPQNIFSITALYKVLKARDSSVDSIDDEFFLNDADKHTAAIAGRFGEGPSLQNVVKNKYSERYGKDKSNWQPTNGGGFWSIVKHEPKKYESEYYIAVVVPCTKLSDELCGLAESMGESDLDIHTGKTTTFKDFYQHDDYRLARNLSRRNADKIAWIVAKQYGVHIKHKVDNNAAFDVSHLKQGKIAVPDHMAMFNHLDLVNVNIESSELAEGVECVAIYSEAGSKKYSVNGFPVPISPRLGIEFYPNIVSNTKSTALPAGPAVTGKAALQSSDLRFNERHLFWKGKRGKAVHPEMLKTYAVDENNVFSDFVSPNVQRKRLANVLVYFS